MTVLNQNKYETPTYDKLPPRRQKYVNEYIVRFNGPAAARKAGVSKNTAVETSKRYLEEPEIQTAIKELLDVNREETENGRQAVVSKLLAQAMVTLDDLTRWDHEQNKRVPRHPDDIDVFYKPCVGMLTISRERDCVFNQGAQHNAIKLLQQYMLWDKELRDDLPAVSFSFGGVKSEAYVMPKK